MTSLKTLLPLLVYTFIFLLPIQLGKHFFPSYAYIDGIRIDYLDPALYLTDIVAVILLIIYRKKLVLPKTKLITIFIILLAVKIILSPKWVLWSFLFASILQIILATLQITAASSMQGIFYFLGERYFTIGTPGIAKVVINGAEVLRPYGTFSHPNSLAGFFLLAHTFFLWNKDYKNYPLLKNFVLGASAVLVLMSFSKIAILILAATYIVYGIKNYKICKVCSIGKALTMLLIATVFMATSGDPDTIQKRVLLAKHAIKIITDHPLTGVGLGNYVIAESRFPNPYPYVFIEPVHNILLLFVAEAGLILTFLTGVILIPFLKKLSQNETARYALTVIIITGFFDHYWLTLQQNMLLAPILFGLLQKRDSVIE